MREKIILTIVLILMLATQVVAVTDNNYDERLYPTEESNTIITWDIIDVPEVPFSWWGSGFVFIGNWIADDSTNITYEITEIGESDEYLTGDLVLGNLSLTTNDTEIANNLILGISGLAPWTPGLVISVGDENIQNENETAYAAAERIEGNWGNGTVESWYETLAINGVNYDCIIWNFTQDQPSYGDPQLTYLAYDLVTGVLVKCNSTYRFNVPYVFVMEINNIAFPNLSILPLVILGVAGVSIVVIVAVIILKKR